MNVSMIFTFEMKINIFQEKNVQRVMSKWQQKINFKKEFLRERILLTGNFLNITQMSEVRDNKENV